MGRPNTTTLALLGAMVLLVAMIAGFALTRDTNQDRLGDSATVSVDNPDFNQACSGQPVYEQIKRALFAQAAQLRGDQEDVIGLQRIGANTAIRMENPAAEGEGRNSGLIDCAGSLAIDLPPGVTTAAGRRLLMTDIYYSVEPQARRLVQVHNADQIVGELAGLTVAPPASSPPPDRAGNLDSADGTSDPLAPLPQDDGQPGNQL